MNHILKNGQVVEIPGDEIIHYVKALDISRKEAIEMWLADHDYVENAEQEELDSKAKKNHIEHGANDIKKAKKPRKPHETKVSDEKKALFECILTNLDRCHGENFDVYRENIAVLRENKLIQVQIGEKIFKIDIIEQRKPK